MTFYTTVFSSIDKAEKQVVAQQGSRHDAKSWSGSWQGLLKTNNLQLTVFLFLYRVQLLAFRFLLLAFSF